VTPKGEHISVEFLIDERRSSASHALHQEPRYARIDATLRVVDPVQYLKRINDFDFDLVIQRFHFSTTPGVH